MFLTLQCGGIALTGHDVFFDDEATVFVKRWTVFSCFSSRQCQLLSDVIEQLIVRDGFIQNKVTDWNEPMLSFCGAFEQVQKDGSFGSTGK